MIGFFIAVAIGVALGIVVTLIGDILTPEEKGEN